MRKIILLVTLFLSGLILGGCCDEDFVNPDYNFIEYAFDMTPFLGECSDEEAFSTVGATADGQAGECWFNTGPLHNRWFKFTATNSTAISINLNIGSQRNTYGVLFDSEGNELDCEVHYSEDDNVQLYTTGLTVGETYYFSVDVENAESVGTFTICIYDIF
jgi:hypothetical protein